MAANLLVIPARLKATRLPGKPLAEIAGEPMIVHVWRRAVEADCGPVVVVTDALEVCEAVKAAGGEAMMTREDHISGSDRIFEAVEKLDPAGRLDIIVNLQGDLPTLEPGLVRACLSALSDPCADIGTIAAKIIRGEERTDPNVVKVVGSPLNSGSGLRALYSRAPPRLGAKARSTIISVFTLTGARRSRASFRCRRHRSRNGRSSSSFGRWRLA
jgi:3-deoxy-manno-octulosonate cytidylyltransferase (CMP-KDO synthetase)